MISTSREFHDVCYFRSFYFGPSGSSIELVPISKSFQYQSWTNDACLYAIRAFNCNNELCISKTIDDMTESPIVDSLTKNDSQPRKHLVVKSMFQTFEDLVHNAIIEFGLNEDQARYSSC